MVAPSAFARAVWRARLLSRDYFDSALGLDSVFVAGDADEALLASALLADDSDDDESADFDSPFESLPLFGSLPLFESVLVFFA